MFIGRAWVNLVSCLITLSVALVTFSQLHNGEELLAGNHIDWLTTGSQLEDVIQCLNSIRLLNQSEELSHQQLFSFGRLQNSTLVFTTFTSFLLVIFGLSLLHVYTDAYLITIFKIKYATTLRQFFPLRIHCTDNYFYC
jgi:hypothetical protein